MALTTPQKQIYSIRDHKAFNAKMILYISVGYTAVQANVAGAIYGQDIYAMQTGNTMFLSDGTTPVVKSHGPYTTNAQPWNNTFNSTGDYKAVEDKAVFVFQDAAGVVHRYQLPCPLASIFLADQQTIDISQTVVKVFVADMLNASFNGQAKTAGILFPVQSASGFALTSFVGGYRLMRKAQRKFNVFTLNPSLNGPGE